MYLLFIRKRHICRQLVWQGATTASCVCLALRAQKKQTKKPIFHTRGPCVWVQIRSWSHLRWSPRRLSREASFHRIKPSQPQRLGVKPQLTLPLHFGLFFIQPHISLRFICFLQIGCELLKEEILFFQVKLIHSHRERETPLVSPLAASLRTAAIRSPQ